MKYQFVLCLFQNKIQWRGLLFISYLRIVLYRTLFLMKRIVVYILFENCPLSHIVPRQSLETIFAACENQFLTLNGPFNFFFGVGRSPQQTIVKISFFLNNHQQNQNDLIVKTIVYFILQYSFYFYRRNNRNN